MQMCTLICAAERHRRLAALLQHRQQQLSAAVTTRVLWRRSRAELPASTGPATGEWLGARLQELDDGAFSAYGIAKDDGGVAIIEVPEGSAAARAGLKTGDLILQVNDSRLSSMKKLLKAVRQSKDKPTILKVFRQQQSLTLTVQP